MEPRFSVLALIVLVLTACVSGGMGTYLPAPSDVAITAPASDLPPELAAFSGAWEGIWDGVLPSRLIVGRIDTTSARVVYIWAGDPNGYLKAGWSRYNAKVLPNGRIEFGGSGIPHFVFTMSKDRTTIAGERDYRGRINTVTMKKITTVSLSFEEETEISKKIPLPQDVKILPPSAELPYQISIWSGKRGGVWIEEGLESILIVERVDMEKMDVIYATGPSQRNPKGNYWRIQAKVIQGGKKIELFFPGRYPLTIVFEMQEDGSVHGVGTISGHIWNIVMKKVAD